MRIYMELPIYRPLKAAAMLKKKMVSCRADEPNANVISLLQMPRLDHCDPKTASKLTCWRTHSKLTCLGLRHLQEKSIETKQTVPLLLAPSRQAKKTCIGVLTW